MTADLVSRVGGLIVLAVVCVGVFYIISRPNRSAKRKYRDDSGSGIDHSQFINTDFSSHSNSSDHSSSGDSGGGHH
jgi:hypothetical protein